MYQFDKKVKNYHLFQLLHRHCGHNHMYVHQCNCYKKYHKKYIIVQWNKKTFEETRRKRHLLCCQPCCSRRSRRWSSTSACGPGRWPRGTWPFGWAGWPSAGPPPATDAGTPPAGLPWWAQNRIPCTDWWCVGGQCSSYTIHYAQSHTLPTQEVQYVI